MKVQGQYLTALQRKLLLKHVKTDLRPEYRLRIEIMLLADAGESQSEICSILGCSHATARYWISMVQIGKFYMWDDCPVGRPRTISNAYVKRLEELVLVSPREYGYSFRRWTAMWLRRHLAGEFGIEVTERHINRILKELGLSTKQNKLHADKTDVKSRRIIIRDLSMDTLSPFYNNSLLWI
jgi:transposase